MNVTLVSGRDLSSDLVGAWRAVQQANPDLAGPYFCPEFTSVVAQVRPDVQVAVVEEAGVPVAFFPFERQGRVGGPVGGILSDYQGVICRPGFACDPRELVRRCGLVAWDFDHLIPGQRFFSAYHRFTEPSPQIDLTAGYDGYVAGLRAAGSEQVRKAGNLARRIAREVGPLRFVPHTPDTALLGQVLGWKSQQYLATGKSDLFAIDWFRETVERVQGTQADHFSGCFSVLFAGDRLVAGHMGMRSGSVWHYWFPAYDPDAAKYSPGILLLLKLAEHAAGVGVSVVDLGKGVSQYKERLMNSSVSVAAGSVETFSWLRCRRAAVRCARGLLTRTGMAKPFRSALRWLGARR